MVVITTSSNAEIGSSRKPRRNTNESVNASQSTLNIIDCRRVWASASINSGLPEKKYVKAVI
jgi:hypothetical protein